MEAANISINFNLRQPRKVNGSPTTIVILLSYQGKQNKVYSGIKVYPYQWNKRKQRTKIEGLDTVEATRNNIEANRKMDAIQAEYENAYMEYIQGNKYAMTAFIEALKGNGNGINKAQEQSENSEHNQQIAKSANSISFPNGSSSTKPIECKGLKATLQEAFNAHYANHKQQTKAIYQGLLNKFFQWLSASGITSVTSALKQTTINQYRQYLITQGFSPKNVNGKLQFIASLNRKMMSDNNFQGFKLKPIYIEAVKDARDKEDARTQPLNEEVITKVEAASSNFTKKQKEWWNVAKLQLLTGQRESDVYKLLKGEYTVTESNGVKMAILQTTKKHTTAHIILTNEIEAILQQTTISTTATTTAFNFNYNRALKAIFKVAGINTPFQWNVNKGGIIQTQTKPLYEVISSHFLRKTFIRNKYKEGYSKEAIAKMVGHSNTEMLDRVYLVLSNKDKADEVAAEYAKVNQ